MPVVIAFASPEAGTTLQQRCTVLGLLGRLKRERGGVVGLHRGRGWGDGDFVVWCRRHEIECVLKPERGPSPEFSAAASARRLVLMCDRLIACPSEYERPFPLTPVWEAIVAAEAAEKPVYAIFPDGRQRGLVAPENASEVSWEPVYALLAEKRVNAALDILLERLDTLYDQGRFDLVEDYLRTADRERLGRDLWIGLECATFCVRHKTPLWNELFRQEGR